MRGTGTWGKVRRISILGSSTPKVNGLSQFWHYQILPPEGTPLLRQPGLGELHQAVGEVRKVCVCGRGGRGAVSKVGGETMRNGKG